LSNMRYRVRPRDTKGFTETLMVWAESETEALNDPKLWFQVQHDLGQLWIDEEARRMERIDVDDKKIFVGLTKDQIKDSPEYDPAQFDEDYRKRLGTYYDPFL
jgi:hypothetical protein